VLELTLTHPVLGFIKNAVMPAIVYQDCLGIPASSCQPRDQISSFIAYTLPLPFPISITLSEANTINQHYKMDVGTEEELQVVLGGNISFSRCWKPLQWKLGIGSSEADCLRKGKWQWECFDKLNSSANRPLFNISADDFCHKRLLRAPLTT
jgi:hypothetical protein